HAPAPSVSLNGAPVTPGRSVDNLLTTMKRILARCYRLYRSAGAARRTATSKTWNAMRTELGRISADVFTFLERHVHHKFVTDWSNDEAVFTGVHSLLYLNAKTWTRENAKQYNWMCG